MILKGELFALLAAFLWAVAAVLFKRLGKSIPPADLNLVKGVLATFLVILTSLILKETLPVLSTLTIAMLLFSGAIGIGFGDTMYFEALNQLGPRRALLLSILAPPIAAIMGWIFLKESLSWFSWLGILLTIIGVAWVISEGSTGKPQARKFAWMGVLFGFLAALSQAIGAVISRWALTETDVSALQTAVIRLVAGCVFLGAWFLFQGKKPGAWIKTESSWSLWGTISIVVLVGTYLAIWLQQLSFQFAPVGIAQTLLATSPLFILPISAILGEKISPRAVLGVLLSTAGVFLLFMPF